jgi:hypothetical protein
MAPQHPASSPATNTRRGEDGRTTNKLMTATQSLMTSTAEGTQGLITQTPANTQSILERMDQQANQRQRELMEAIQALKR